MELDKQLAEVWGRIQKKEWTGLAMEPVNIPSSTGQERKIDGKECLKP